MSTPIVIPDAALEAMLTRRAHRADPGTLRDEAFARIDAIEPRRHLLAWPATAAGGGWSARQAVLVAAAMLLLAAAVSGALIGARLLDQTRPAPFDTSLQNLNDTTPATVFVPGPRALVPTGIGVLLDNPTSYTALVADGEGIAWLREDTGSIVRFDPLSRTRQSWTVADVAAIGSAEQIIPARSGGIWLVGRRALWWFDGERIRDGFETPPDLPPGSAGDLTVATEAPDGTLWAATPDGTVLHWDGSSWSRLVAPQANTEACAQPDASCYPGAIAVDAAGRAWVGWIVYPIPPNVAWVSRYDGSAWAVLDDGLTSNRVESIAQQPDGSIWAITDDALARLDGTSWVDATAELDGRCTSSLAVALDAALWCAGPGSSDGAVAAWRFDGRTWVSGGEAGGLSGIELETVVPAKDGTFVGVTGTGDTSAIHVLVDGRWEQHPSPGSGPPITGDGRPVLAISRDELWAIGEGGGVWHFSGGAWTMEAIDPAHPGSKVRDLALAPDGTPWAAGDDGVAYWRDGRWVVADGLPANVVTVDREGTAWVSRDKADISTLTSDGTGWTSAAIATCPPGCFGGGGGVWSMAVDEDGALWVGAGGFVVDALARWADGRWETFDASDGVPNNHGVEVLGISAAGDVWIGFRPRDAGPNGHARFDGTEWKVAEPLGDVAISPDGTPWAATDRGPAYDDGQQWTFPYSPVSSPGRITVAPDGTVFTLGPGGMAAPIWRFPAVTRPRTPAASP